MVGIKLASRYLIILVFGIITFFGSTVYGQYSVINTNDEGPGSLRQAMLNVLEEDVERPEISFDIPGEAPHTIYPESPLPIMSKPVIIDATTQTGYSGSPVIEISGEEFPFSNGFVFEGGNTIVKGLAINSFEGVALFFQLEGNNLVEGNYLGTDITGTEVKRNGGFGIFLSDIGDNILRDNVISGNSMGIYAQFDNADNNQITGNKIGTDVSGEVALGNEVDGIRLMSGVNVNEISGNVIAGNGGHGILIVDFLNIITGNNIISQNWIGTNVGQTSIMPNELSGVHISNSSENEITNNVISGNNGDGIELIDNILFKTDSRSAFVDEILTLDGIKFTRQDFETREQPIESSRTTGNKISQNSIFLNSETGIDLNADGITENDDGDSDAGPNNVQNFPEIQSVAFTEQGDELTIHYRIPSNPDYSVYPIVAEFYVESNGRQGELFLGSDLYGDSDFPSVKEIVLDVSGLDLSAGSSVVASATDAANNTSEFGNPISTGSTGIASPVLVSPENTSTGLSLSPTLIWSPVDEAEYYSVEVATDGDFQSVFVEAGNIESSGYTLSDLDYGTTYHWRVKAHSNSESSRFSEGWRFTTEEAPRVSVFTDSCTEQSLDVERAIRGCAGEINFSELSSLLEKGNQQLELNLFGGEISAVAIETGTEIWSETEFSWFGRLQSETNESIILEVNLDEKRAFATMTLNNRPYRLEYIENNLHVIYEVDLRGLIDEHNDVEDIVEDNLPEIDDPFEQLDAPKSKVDLQSTPVAASSNQNDPVIDLLILYTQQAQNSAGSKQQILTEIRNAVNITNSTFRNSGINARVRLSSAWSIAYSETGKSKDDLSNLRISGESSSYTANYLKKISGADIVGLIVSDIDDACGRAYRMDDVSTSFRKNAYFVVGQDVCLGNTLAFPHEIGHIMAARHDWRVTDGADSPYPYNHGYVNLPSNWSIPDSDSLDASKQWMTVMAYNDRCKDVGEDCYRIWNWSNPNATFLGDPLGNDSDLFLSDNVRTLNNTASTVAAFSNSNPAVFGFITDVETGLPLEGVDVKASDGRTVTTNDDGFYDFLLTDGNDLDIEPELESYLFLPETGSVSNISSDIQIDFEAYPIYTISGRITENGSPLQGIEMRGITGIRPETDSNGEYEVSLPFGWSGTITPYSRAFSFSPERREYVDLSDSLDNQNFSAELNTYIVSGSIRDLNTGTMVDDVLLDGFPGVIITNAGGFYSVELDHGWSGTVYPVKPGFNFEPLNREYTRLSSDRSHDYDAYSGWLARSDWPMFQANPKHSGAVNNQAVSDDVKWNKQLSGEIISLISGPDGTIYAGTDQGGLHFYSAAGQYSGDMRFVNSITATPALTSGNRLYLPLDDTVKVINLYQGLSTQTLLTTDEGGFYSSPVINPENGMVYIGSDDGDIYAVTPDNTVEWIFSTNGQVHSSPAISSDGTIVVGSDDNNVYAINPDGTQKWVYSTSGDVRSSPAIGSNGSVYIGSDDGFLYSLDSGGGLNWGFNAGSAIQSTPAIDSNGNIYFGSDDGLFYSINKSGSLNWSYTTGGPIKSSPAISQTKVRLFTGEQDEEVVYVGSEDGYLYAFDIISLTGNSPTRLRWKYNFGSPVNGSPILTNGLIAGSDDGKLLAFRQVSRAWTQGVILAQDDVLTPDEIAIVIWLDEIGGIPGIIGGNPGLKPCEGGPLIIPNCPYDDGIFGTASPFLPVFPDEELIVGLVRTSSDIEAILTGETTEGLIGTFSTRVNDTDASSLFFGGVINTEGYADNPDGRPIGLQMFNKAGLQETITNNPEQTTVYAGNFSTDSPAMDITLDGPVSKTFSSLKFGDISNIETLPAGNYQVTLELAESALKTNNQNDFTYELDLTGNSGEPVAIIVDGFLNPEANKNGQSLGVNSVTSKGSVPTSIITEPPSSIALHDNYPNPFNPVTSIPFEVKEAGIVRLEIFNIAGQKVSTLIDDVLPPGYHVSTFDASEMASGVYIYRLVTNSFSQSKKMVLIK